MRDIDEQVHPEALARQQAAELATREAIVKFVAGMVIAIAGLLAAFFVEGGLYLGFGAAMVGTGIVPFDKIANVFKRD